MCAYIYIYICIYIYIYIYIYIFGLPRSPPAPRCEHPGRVAAAECCRRALVKGDPCSLLQQFALPRAASSFKVSLEAEQADHGRMTADSHEKGAIDG